MDRNPLHRLQARVTSEEALVLAGVKQPKVLIRQIRSRLNAATLSGAIVGDRAHLVWWKKASIKRPNAAREDVIAVIGGVEINRDRSRDKPHFPRADGAWFDFHIHLNPYRGDRPELRGSLELLGYGYEIRFPEESFDTDIRWLRFDLNHPAHANEDRAMRCHLHPGDEDLQVPAAVMHPLEALELLLTPKKFLWLPEPAKRRRA